MNKTNITEIIPDDMPEWMLDAMDEGQLFRTVIDKFKSNERVHYNYMQALLSDIHEDLLSRAKGKGHTAADPNLFVDINPKLWARLKEVLDKR